MQGAFFCLESTSQVSSYESIDLRVQYLPLLHSCIEKSTNLTEWYMIHSDDLIITACMTCIERSTVQRYECVSKLIGRASRRSIGRHSDKPLGTIADLFSKCTHSSTLWSISFLIECLSRTLQFPIHNRITKLIYEDHLSLSRNWQDDRSMFLHEDFPGEYFPIRDTSVCLLHHLHPLPGSLHGFE